MTEDPYALIRAAAAEAGGEHDVLRALRSLPAARAELDRLECALIERYLDAAGATWDSLAAALGARSGDALRVRYRRLGGTRNWPTGPKTKGDAS